MEPSRATATTGATVSTGRANSSHRFSAGPNEEPPSRKRVRSSDNEVPACPANMRHLLNAENSTPEVDSRAPENASSEMCSMKLPRHTERSYAQEVKSKSLLVSTIPSYRIFSEGQVPFKHVESLGRGNLALIDKVEHTTADATPGKAYARKILPASRVQNARDLLEALEASKTLCHQHIVTIILTYEEVGPQKRNFGIIMEPIAENNLQDYLEELHESGKCMEPNNQTMLRKWFGCLASVLAYTHAKEIRHENIQPSNILVKDNEIFFASFGVSKHFRSDDIAGEATGRPDAQHAAYVAPEVESDRPQNFKADIFSLGCVYLDILTVIAGKYRKGFPRWRSKKSSSEIQVYLGQLSVYLENPQNESLNEFYQQMIKVCTQMLENSPSIRPSAFMIAERVFEAQGLWEMACDCMNPWFSSGDAAIKLKIPGLRKENLTTELRKMGFGSFRAPLDLFKFFEESTCKLCQAECKSFEVFLGHLFEDHLDMIPFVKGRDCSFTACKGLPIFETEEIYLQHLNIRHEMDEERATQLGYL